MWGSIQNRLFQLKSELILNSIFRLSDFQIYNILWQQIPNMLEIRNKQDLIISLSWFDFSPKVVFLRIFLLLKV